MLVLKGVGPPSHSTSKLGSRDIFVFHFHKNIRLGFLLSKITKICLKCLSPNFSNRQSRCQNGGEKANILIHLKICLKLKCKQVSPCSSAVITIVWGCGAGWSSEYDPFSQVPSHEMIFCLSSFPMWRVQNFPQQADKCCLEPTHDEDNCISIFCSAGDHR